MLLIGKGNKKEEKRIKYFKRIRNGIKGVRTKDYKCKEEEPKRNKYINGVCIGERRIKKEYFVKLLNDPIVIWYNV